MIMRSPMYHAHMPITNHMSLYTHSITLSRLDHNLSYLLMVWSGTFRIINSCCQMDLLNFVQVICESTEVISCCACKAAHTRLLRVLRSVRRDGCVLNKGQCSCRTSRLACKGSPSLIFRTTPTSGTRI